MLLFCVKTVSYNFELVHLQKEVKENWFWLFCDFLVQCFHDAFRATGSVLAMETLEDEWYVAIKAYRFTIFKRFFNVQRYLYIYRVWTLR